MRPNTVRPHCVSLAAHAPRNIAEDQHRRRVASRATLALGCAAALAGPLRGQPLEWYFDPNINGSVRIEGGGFADDHITAAVNTVHNLRTLWTPGAPYAMGFLTYGTSFSVSFDETALDLSPAPSYAAARTFPYVMLYGFGTDTVDIVWLARVDVASNSPLGWDCSAYADLRFVIDMRLQNIQPTTPIDIDYQYYLHSRTWTEHDNPPFGLPAEDLVFIRQTNLFIDGNNLTAERFDINTLPGPGNISAQREYHSPVFTKSTTAGTGIRVEVNGLVDGQIHLFGPDSDHAWAYWTGHIRLKARTPGGIVQELLPTTLAGGYLDFSLDVGSDAELSDPVPNGNEMFDPGDIYAWRGSAVPPPGIDGYRNDATWWANGADPAPTPGLAGSAAPVCVPPPAGGWPPNWFDLDAHDTLDFDLASLVTPGAALAEPIQLFDSLCVNQAQYLLASYDDDLSGNLSSCQTPTAGSSPWGGCYGTSTGRDEVFGITTTGSASSPAAVLMTYPYLSEVELHAGLAPNPDLGELEDDDVDSLDALPDSGCDYVLFSVDHETPTPVRSLVRGTMDPASVYAPVPGGNPRLVVSGGIHLGLPGGADLNAIEFCWTWTTLPDGTSGDVLTLLFTVDVDDPATADDESGGLDPRMIYASQLTGNHYPFLSAPLADVIDALASWRHAVRAASGSRADLNCDATIDFFDIDPFLLALFNPAGYSAAYPDCTLQTADVNGDGAVDFFDIDAFLACLFGTCP